MNTYCKKMYWLSIGRVSSIAVSSLLPKKNAMFITLHLLFLSIFNTRVLNFFFPSLILSTSNLLRSKVMINTGATTEMTKKKYEKKSATFLITVVLFPSMIFMMEKKVKSKYTSMKNLRYTLNLN